MDSHSWDLPRLRKVTPHMPHLPAFVHSWQQTGQLKVGHLNNTQIYMHKWKGIKRKLFYKTKYAKKQTTYNRSLKMSYYTYCAEKNGITWVNGWIVASSNLFTPFYLTVRLCLTLVSGEFTVSGFSWAHEVFCNDHGCETHITVVFPHQTSKSQPEKRWRAISAKDQNKSSPVLSFK